MTTKRDITTILGGTIGAFLSIWAAFAAVDWVCSLVPASEPHAALIRLAVGFTAIGMFGGLGILFTLLAIWFFGWLGGCVGALFYRKGKR